MQLTHYTSKFKRQKFPIILVCDDIKNAANIGSIFRAADAFGIEKIIFCGADFSIGKRVTKTSRSAEKYVNYSIETDVFEVLKTLKNKNYYLIGLEITEKSESLSNFELKTDQPIGIILGNENFGISDSVLNICDKFIHIEMYGNNSSMNVAQATSILLYELTKQL